MSGSSRPLASPVPLDSSTAVARASRLAANRLQPIRSSQSSASAASSPSPTASSPSSSSSSPEAAMSLRPRAAPAVTSASVRGPLPAAPPAKTAKEPTGSSGGAVRGGKKSSRQASKALEGWEEELERQGVAAISPPPSSLHVKTTSSSPVSPHSAASSPSNSYSSPFASEPVSPIVPIRQLSRPSSAGRPSFGHQQHGATATALTHATSSLSLSLSSLSTHPSMVRLHDSLTALPLLPAASAWLGVDIVYVALVGVCAALAVSLGLVGLYGILEFLLFLYPAYMSYHALEYEPLADDDADDEEDDELVRSWLTYWSVYALFVVLSTVTDWVLWNGSWYRAGRLLLLLALSYPSSPLPAFLFHWLIRPLYVANLPALDAAVDWVVQGAVQVVDECRVTVKEGVVWWLRGGQLPPVGAAGSSGAAESSVLRGRRGARRGGT